MFSFLLLLHEKGVAPAHPVAYLFVPSSINASELRLLLPFHMGKESCLVFPSLLAPENDDYLSLTPSKIKIILGWVWRVKYWSSLYFGQLSSSKFIPGSVLHGDLHLYQIHHPMKQSAYLPPLVTFIPFHLSG